MKRIAFVLIAACAIVLASTGMAFANFGPHGAYTADTDACAACHRAHTSFSTLGWTDKLGAQRDSALLIAQANNMSSFCYACHGDAAPGASTNVQSGIFDAGPSSGVGSPAGSYAYTTNSSYGATLNGGGFDYLGGHVPGNASPTNPAQPTMSSHNMDNTGPFQGSLIKWGNADLTPMSTFTCTDCHDPHGSSNYRLLKDQLGSASVGGYTAGNVPTPFVISNEQGYPTGGFKKGDAGVADGKLYVPNYTNAEYAVTGAGKNMSGWCAGCHTGYNLTSSTTDYGTYLSTSAGQPSANPLTYHRHPVDVPLTANLPGSSAQALTVSLLVDPGLPLDMPVGNNVNQSNHALQSWNGNGQIDCLTCHRAHGSEATMSGWAIATLTNGQVSMLNGGVAGNPSLAAAAGNPGGVAPNFSGALLRYDNRGVCERCHNK